MQIQEILIVKNGQENYGIPIDVINQISRLPALMPLPLRPAGIRGLCSIGGGIVSLIDMNMLLDMKPVNYEAHSARLLSLNDDYSSNALLVSEVFNTIEIDQESIEYKNNEGDPVIAICRYNDILIQVLSVDILISKISKVSIESKEVKAGKTKLEVSKEEDNKRFLIFYMEKEKFALDIEYLQEIILAQREFTDIVGAGDDIVGLVTLRDEVLLVVDLRLYFGFDTLQSDKNRILIASYDGKRVGLLIDAIIDIKNFSANAIEYMNSDSEDVKVSGVIHDEKSLISFFDDKVLSNIISKNNAYIDEPDTSTEMSDTELSLLEVIVFKLAGKEYAFEVDHVDEIIDLLETTEIAYSEKSVDGIINIRGQIVTIISLFSKLNIPSKIEEDSKIIICNIDGNRIGFVVDSVSDILSVHDDEIKEQENDFFSNVLHIENGDRLILSMDIHKIVNSKDTLDG